MTESYIDRCTRVNLKETGGSIIAFVAAQLIDQVGLDVTLIVLPETKTEGGRHVQERHRCSRCDGQGTKSCNQQGFPL